MQIRLAAPDDAPAAAACHLLCWQEAYGGLLPAEYLAGLDLAEWTQRWRDRLVGGWHRWLAVEGDEVVGFSSGGPSRDDDAAAGTLELYACYVRASEYGSGLGARLLEAALDGAPATLWVLRDNARARTFYGKHGFTPDGGDKLDPRFEAWEARLRRG